MNRPLLIALLALNIVLHATEAPVSIRATPKVQLYQKDTQTVHLSVHAPKNAQNRLLCIDVDGPIYQSDCRDFVGVGAPYAVDWWVRGLEPGRYVASATLTQVDGRRFTESDTFCIVGGDEECGLEEP